MSAKIGIIEDDEVLLKMLTRELREVHFDVVEASDGITGLELAEKEKPDFLILDVSLPKMDGFEFFEALREKEFGAKIPVIFLVGRHAEEEEIQKRFSSRFSNYLVKPKWEIPQILEKIKEKLLPQSQG